MKVISYRLYLEQPLLATQLLGDPNSSVSLPYVPGSLIRGLLVHRYSTQEKLTEQDDFFAQDAPEQLFFNAGARYLNAYPLAEDRYRTLPTPLSLLKRKNDLLDDKNSAELYNSSHAEATIMELRDFEGDDNTKPVGYSFCRLADDEVRLYRLEPNRVAVHVQRERVKGRATREKGAVFQYEALAEHQWFSGAILVEHDAHAPLIEAWLKETEVVWLGRSRSANYGRVQISEIVTVQTPWREVDRSFISTGQTISMTLLSDTLLRNTANGQFVGKMDDATLSAYLGASVKIDPERTTSQSIMVGGYNRTWQMPLSQSLALKAGSVFVFEAETAFDAQRAAGLEWQGLGERRAEGFGRVIFNWQAELHSKGSESNLYIPTATKLPTLSATAIRTARQMALRLLEHRIDEAMHRYLRDHILDKNLTSMPANSQLGRVRVLIRRALNANPPDIAMLRISWSNFKDTAQNQFRNAHFDSTSMLEWINTLIADPPASVDQAIIWQKLGISNSSVPTIGSQKATLDTALTHRTTLRLIEAVCVALARKSRREKEVLI